MGAGDIVLDIKRILLPIETVYFNQLDMQLNESGLDLKEHIAEIEKLKQKQKNSILEAFKELCDQKETDFSVFLEIRRTFYLLECDLRDEVDLFIYELKKSDSQ